MNHLNRKHPLTPDRLRISVFVFFISVGSITPALCENWPGWRGPRGDGTSKEVDVPVSWSATQNVLWKTYLGNTSTSSPIVWRDKVYVIGQTGRGPRQSGRVPAGTAAAGVVARNVQHTIAFFVTALGASDGNKKWSVGVDPGQKLVPVHESHNLAMPTPVTDGSRVYTLFGTGVVTCFATNGQGLWQRRLEEDYAPFDIIYGHGSSPVLGKKLLYILADHGIGSYVIALDKRSGETVWKHDRDGIGPSYSTPILANFGSGKELIVTMSYHLRSLDPNTGKLLWQVPGLRRVTIPTPVVSGPLLFASGGVRNGPVMAIRPPLRRFDPDSGHPSAASNESAAPEVIWRKENSSPYVSSMIGNDGLLFYFGDDGVARCIDANTGDVQWKSRLGGAFTGSPVVAEGRIYAMNEDGDTFVIQAGRKFKLISQNKLGERTLASLAISGGKIFIRTDGYLYCIGPSS